VLDLFKISGGRSVKLMIAYHRSLRFDPGVSDAEAAAVFAALIARGPGRLWPEGLRRLQDNLFWHLIELAHARGLPLIVHTGYASPTDWANPDHLADLFTHPRLAGLKVDLAHSGWPNHGPAMILARTYRGAYFNLCWTPLLSRALGKRMLSEAVDMVPADKILLGTDCGTAEAFLGTVRLLRSLLAEVLAEKVEQGQFGIDVAQRLARMILLDNPLAFYGMTAEDVPKWRDDE
jgi:predicted TIM-barrel fold metal-dependent hydrolase